MKHGNAPFRCVWIVCFMRPSIGGIGFGMAVQIKHFDNAFPNCLTIENLFDWHTLTVRGLNAM